MFKLIQTKINFINEVKHGVEVVSVAHCKKDLDLIPCQDKCVCGVSVFTQNTVRLLMTSILVNYSYPNIYTMCL